MLLPHYMVNTDLGTVKTLVAHCDHCGKKHLVSGEIIGGAMGWLEVRRFDKDVPPIHFCTLRCLINGIGGLLELGINELSTDNWARILEYCTKAGEQAVAVVDKEE